MVSPRRRHPKNVVSATAQTAAWNGLERWIARCSANRCSIDTGARRGRLWRDPSLLAEVRAIWTQLSSPNQAAWFMRWKARMPDSQDFIVLPETNPLCSLINAQSSGYGAGIRVDSGMDHRSQNWLNLSIPAEYVFCVDGARAPMIDNLAASTSSGGSVSWRFLSWSML